SALALRAAVPRPARSAEGPARYSAEPAFFHERLCRSDGATFAIERDRRHAQQRKLGSEGEWTFGRVAQFALPANARGQFPGGHSLRHDSWCLPVASLFLAQRRGYGVVQA